MSEINFATIGAVYSDGVTLIFDGETTATDKRYKVNRSVVFSAGQRVKICKDSGTYVVEYPVGNPQTSASIPNKAYGVVDWYNLSRDLQFRCDGTNYYIRLGPTGSWKKITVT